MNEIKEKERRVREFLQLKGLKGSPSQASGQLFVDDMWWPQSGWNCHGDGGHLTPHHGEFKICHLEQYRSPSYD